jgi:hypothetical protein
MRLVTFQRQGVQEIGALVEADSKIIRLQAAERLRGGEDNLHFQSMLGFLRGAGEARDSALGAIDFALSQRPENIGIQRASVELLSPVPRPESIREFMVFELQLPFTLINFFYLLF